MVRYMRSLPSGGHNVLGQRYVASEEGTQPKYCTVYTHMVKAGGSSLKQKLLIAAREDGGPPPRELLVHRERCLEMFCIEV